MNNAPSNQPVLVSSTTREDEINLLQVAGALGRHRRLIAKVAGASLLLSVIYAFSQKPVWKGHFQIVLENHDLMPHNLVVTVPEALKEVA